MIKILKWSLASLGILLGLSILFKDHGPKLLNFAILLFTINLVAFVVGMIRPTTILKDEKANRKSVLLKIGIPLIASFMWARSIGDSHRNNQTFSKEAALSVISKQCSFDRGEAEVVGEVQNISSKPIEQLAVSANFRDSKGAIVDSAIGGVDLRPLNPGEKSAFSAHLSKAIGVTNCEVAFKIFGGDRVAHVDNSQSATAVQIAPDAGAPPVTPWDLVQQSIEQAYKEKLCLRCGGFSFTLYSEGITNKNLARIYLVNYVEIYPGDHRTKHKKCSYAHVAYDQDFKSTADLFVSFSDKSVCSGSDQIYAGAGAMTFKQRANEFKYSGLIPD